MGISIRRHAFALPRRIRPSFASRSLPLKDKGRREGRVLTWHPRSAARRCSAKRPHSSIQVWPNTRPSLRDGRTAYAVLSREPNSFWPPSCLRKVPAPRRLARMPHPQGLAVATTAGTTRFCRTRAHPASPRGFAGLRRRSYNAACETLTGFGSIHRPALRSHPRRRCPRPPRPDPRLVTTYDRPFSPDQDGRYIRQIRISVKWNILDRGG
ncbi:hypothetical protein M2427_000917 [Bradyrhizobium sp. BR13661]|jgi:hypothetical protein|nr:hypothetical protein [Bradyrhizobium sp. BR13661]